MVGDIAIVWMKEEEGGEREMQWQTRAQEAKNKTQRGQEAKNKTQRGQEAKNKTQRGQEAKNKTQRGQEAKNKRQRTYRAIATIFAAVSVLSTPCSSYMA
jgi:hypothetical protein